MKKWFSRLLSNTFGGQSKKIKTTRHSAHHVQDGLIEPKVFSGDACLIDRSHIASYAVSTVKTLKDAGFEAYVVGGAVRDLLLDLEPKDFDVATNAHPEQVLKLFRRARLIGRRFQIVHAYFGREVVEISTFRAALQDNVLTDQHGRVLADNQFGLIESDAARRDLTINALYYDPVDHILLDYTDGVADIKQKLIRILGDPKSRYIEDPVRMLRVVRFASKLDFEIHADSIAPIAQCADLLYNVPSARLFDEAIKFFTFGRARRAFDLLGQHQLLHFVVPVAQKLYKTENDWRFVRQALDNSDERIAQQKSISPGFLFAALLWPPVRAKWQQLLQNGLKPVEALDQAITSVVETNLKEIGMTRRFFSDVQVIWQMQPRFERRVGQMPFRMLENPRLRAGFDFLLLRAQNQEVPNELAGWWNTFIHEPEQREQCLELARQAGATPPSAAKKRKRKRKPKTSQALEGASSHTNETNPTDQGSAEPS
jgi:poly(A) polymerase